MRTRLHATLLLILALPLILMPGRLEVCCCVLPAEWDNCCPERPGGGGEAPPAAGALAGGDSCCNSEEERESGFRQSETLKSCPTMFFGSEDPVETPRVQRALTGPALAGLPPRSAEAIVAAPPVRPRPTTRGPPRSLLGRPFVPGTVPLRI